MSDERGLIERGVFVAAAPETLFAFLTDPFLMARWIGIKHTVEPQPGGVFRVEVSEGHIALGKFTEVVPNRRVAFTWGWQSKDPALAALKPGESLVEIDLEPREGGTLVRLRHSRLPKDITDVHGDRWSHYLGKLQLAASETEKEGT